MLTQAMTSYCNKALTQPRAQWQTCLFMLEDMLEDIFRVNSGVRQVSEDQRARLISKIKESFPKYDGNEGHIKKIVGIVNSCIRDERLVRIHSAHFLCSKNKNKLETCMVQFLGSYI